jgi:hypothetical protein
MLGEEKCSIVSSEWYPSWTSIELMNSFVVWTSGIFYIKFSVLVDESLGHIGNG